MMKTLFATLLLAGSLMLNFNAFSQDNSNADSRLNSKFSKSELKALSAEELAYWEFFVEQGFELFTISKEKASSDIGAIAYNGDLDAINPLDLGLEPEETAVKTYQIGDTNKGIMILSKKKILAKMERLKQ